MTNVNIITVGKLKEDFLKGAQAEYSKRLSPFCKLKVVEITESRLSDNPSQKEIEHSLGEEARSIKPYIEQKGSYSIVLCIEGIKLSSPALAEKILKLGVDGFSTLNFVIGSSFGIADEIKKSLCFASFNVRYDFSAPACKNYAFRADLSKLSDY